jgi:hypothetical protein
MLRSDLPISLPYHSAVDYDDLLGIDMDQGAADMGSFIVPFKCKVLLAGLMITETNAGATTPGVVKYDKRPTAGSDTARGDGDIAEFKLLTTAAGKFLYDEVGVGITLEPGQEVVVQLVTQPVGSPAGHVRPSLLVEYMPETKANLANLVVTT